MISALDGSRAVNSTATVESLLLWKKLRIVYSLRHLHADLPAKEVGEWVSE
jgi:hypothetical protein